MDIAEVTTITDIKDVIEILESGCVKKRLASGDINILTPMKFLK